jgi:serine protease AprX
MNNMQVADAIRKSASQYNFPDDMLGYGVPDFVFANNILTVISGPEQDNKNVDVYPNPFSDSFIIDAWKQAGRGAGNNEIAIEITDLAGRIIGTQKANLTNSAEIYVDLLQNSPNGLYFVKVRTSDTESILKVVKE